MTAINKSVGTALNKMHALKGVASRDRQFRAMMRQDEELREDPGSARKYFEVVQRASPYIASEPVVAAHIVKNMMQVHYHDPKMFKDILEVEKTRRGTLPSSDITGGETAIRGIGGMMEG